MERDWDITLRELILQHKDSIYSKTSSLLNMTREPNMRVDKTRSTATTRGQPPTEIRKSGSLTPYPIRKFDQIKRTTVWLTWLSVSNAKNFQWGACFSRDSVQGLQPSPKKYQSRAQQRTTLYENLSLSIMESTIRTMAAENSRTSCSFLQRRKSGQRRKHFRV
jgi:hypothetical protein